MLHRLLVALLTLIVGSTCAYAQTPFRGYVTSTTTIEMVETTISTPQPTKAKKGAKKKKNAAKPKPITKTERETSNFSVRTAFMDSLVSIDSIKYPEIGLFSLFHWGDISGLKIVFNTNSGMLQAGMEFKEEIDKLGIGKKSACINLKYVLGKVLSDSLAQAGIQQSIELMRSLKDSLRDSIVSFSKRIDLKVKSTGLKMVNGHQTRGYLITSKYFEMECYFLADMQLPYSNYTKNLSFLDPEVVTLVADYQGMLSPILTPELVSDWIENACVHSVLIIPDVSALWPDIDEYNDIYKTVKKVDKVTRKMLAVTDKYIVSNGNMDPAQFRFDGYTVDTISNAMVDSFLSNRGEMSKRRERGYDDYGDSYEGEYPYTIDSASLLENPYRMDTSAVEYIDVDYSGETEYEYTPYEAAPAVGEAPAAIPEEPKATTPKRKSTKKSSKKTTTKKPATKKTTR